jgi:hypothetical protein
MSYLHTRTAAKSFVSLCFILICLIAVEQASAQKNSPTPSLNDIVARMEKAREANQAAFRPFTVTRDYRLFGKEEHTARSQVIANVTFVPPGSKNFAITKTSGSGMGESIVRRMLTGEAELADSDQSDISARNYTFRFAGESYINGRRCFLLDLIPKRQDKSLISGRAWIDAQTYLVHRAEGSPVKKPSWWVRDIHISFNYADVDGMWLQTNLEATATVRLIGQCKVVAHDINYAVADAASVGTNAKKNPQRKRIIG